MKESFNPVQEICKYPIKIYVPKKEDHLFIIGDAAPSKGPGIGSKVLIKRRGSERLLPSFNHGLRIKNNMPGWLPCEIESFNLSQAIKKFKPYIRYVSTKTTVLIDFRASVLALQRLERGQMSTSRRLQDLLANVTAENLKVILISAKFSSPMIEYADFASRNPVNCEKKACSICKESESPDITFFAEDENPIEDMPNITIQMWKSIQSSSSNLRKAAALMENHHIEETEITK